MNDSGYSTTSIIPMLRPIDDEQTGKLREASAKLLEMASTGNIDAIRLMQETADRQNYNFLISNMDDDEFTPADFAN